MPRPGVRPVLLIALLGAVLVAIAVLGCGGWDYLVWRFAERMSTADRLIQFAPRVDPLWQARCREVGLAYPPARVRLLALKAEKRLEVYAANVGGPWQPLVSYPVLAASGGPGPKLCEGDNQVPEGFYRIALLNPNSLFHVSLRVDYPNAQDREQGRSDGREHLGGDIMIHGGRASIGCIAIGDPAIEEVFTLAARCGLDHLDALLLPHDFRTRPADPAGVPPWMPARYRDLRALLGELPSAPTIGAP